MKYQDLKKKVNVGPLSNWEEDLVHGSGPLSVARAMDTDTALLFKHCFNNFDRALEALKELNNPASSHEWKHLLAELPALIAELEDVK